MNSLLRNKLTVVRTPTPQKVIMVAPATTAPVPAISPDEIREIVLNYLNMNETPIPPSPEPQVGELIFTFKGVEHFADWYNLHTDDFIEQHRIALGSLIQARQGINAGCSCKRNQRLRMAEDYYVHFFTQNAGSDLITAIKKSTNANVLNFFRDNNLFLKV